MIRLADCASRVVAISARQETGRIIAKPCGGRSSLPASASLHAMAGLKGKADG